MSRQGIGRCTRPDATNALHTQKTKGRYLSEERRTGRDPRGEMAHKAISPPSRRCRRYRSQMAERDTDLEEPQTHYSQTTKTKRTRGTSKAISPEAQRQS